MKKYLLVLLCFFVPLHAKQEWHVYKKEIIKKLKKEDPKVSLERVEFAIDLIKNQKLSSCLEVGFSNGATFFALLWAMEYSGFGRCYGVDCWDQKLAEKYLENFTLQDQGLCDKMYSEMINKLVAGNQKVKYKILRDPMYAFNDIVKEERFDLIDLNLNCKALYAMKMVEGYFNKLEDSGYIILSQPNLRNMRDALVFLLERSDLLTPFTSGASFYVFKKNIKKESMIRQLFLK